MVSVTHVSRPDIGIRLTHEEANEVYDWLRLETLPDPAHPVRAIYERLAELLFSEPWSR